jgi:hypothetical protein
MEKYSNPHGDANEKARTKVRRKNKKKLQTISLSK